MKIWKKNSKAAKVFLILTVQTSFFFQKTLPVFTLPFTLASLLLLLSWPDKGVSSKDRVFTVGDEMKRPQEQIKEDKERKKKMMENIQKAMNVV